MKKILLLCFAVTLFGMALALKPVERIKAYAFPNQYSGVYVYTDCTPDSKYVVLGTVDINERFIVLRSLDKNDYPNIRKRMVSYGLKHYDHVEGVIIDLDNMEAEFIEFK